MTTLSFTPSDVSQEEAKPTEYKKFEAAKIQPAIFKEAILEIKENYTMLKFLFEGTGEVEGATMDMAFFKPKKGDHYKRTTKTVNGKNGPYEQSKPSIWEHRIVGIDQVMRAISSVYRAKQPTVSANSVEEYFDHYCKMANTAKGAAVMIKPSGEINTFTNKEGIEKSSIKAVAPPFAARVDNNNNLAISSRFIIYADSPEKLEVTAWDIKLLDEMKEKIANNRSTANPSISAANNPFGAPAPAANNPFGAPAAAAAGNPFGAPAPAANSPFGAPAPAVAAGSPFGAPAANNTQADPFGAPAVNDPFNC